MMENRACTNFPSCLAAEGAPFYEQRESRSDGKRVARLCKPNLFGMGAAELLLYNGMVFLFIGFCGTIILRLW